MKVFITCSLLLMSIVGHSHGSKKESHGNLEDEVKCTKELSAIGCGSLEATDKFMNCVDQKISSLSVTCQNFHKDEKLRLKGF